MKKIISLLLISVVLLIAIPALAAKSEPVYTMESEGHVLQNIPDRGIHPVGDLSASTPISGESPTTGMPLAESERYLPMLVQIGIAEDSKFGLAGTGDKAPWGLAYADILYESLLYATGQTRFVALFNDSFAQNQPQSVGPVRSARQSIVMLQQEWQGGAVFGGCARVEDPRSVLRMLLSNGVYDAGLVFNLHEKMTDEFKNRIKGIAAPDNYNVNLVRMRSLVPEGTVSTTHPFLFADVAPYVIGYDPAATISLDWGHKSYLSHFKYDESLGQYLRFTGNQPSMVLASAEDRRNAGSQSQMTFSNVIIQRTEYECINESRLLPAIQGTGKGNADIFIQGHYIAGYWVRESDTSPTIFLDDKGNKIYLSRGKTYIAHFPNNALLSHQGQ